MKQVIGIAILVLVVCGCKGTSFEASETEATAQEQQGVTNSTEWTSKVAHTEVSSNSEPTSTGSETEDSDRGPLQRIVIDSDALNIRHTHDANSESLGVAKKNTIYTVLREALDGEGRTWYQIVYSENDLGWIAWWHCRDFMAIPIVQNLLGDWL